MQKIDSSLLVCTAEQSLALMHLGILPVSCFCYEPIDVGEYEFAGEHFDQQNAIPAWTMEELHIMIGGDYTKPDLYTTKDWRETVNMMQYIMYTPAKRKDYQSGATAAAGFLEFLLTAKEITADEANARLQAYATKEHFNPLTENL